MWFSKQLRYEAVFRLFIIGLATCVSMLTLPNVASAQPPAPVIVSEVVQAEVSSSSTFVATVNPLKSATIGSAVDGRVAERFVEIGDRVEKQKPLFQLLTNTIELELKAAEADLKVRQQELAELENGTRPSEIDQAKAKMLAAEATAKFAQAQRDRMQQLRNSNSVPQGELDQAIATYDEATQNYIDLKAAYELAIDGPRSERIERARAYVALQGAEIDRIKDRIEKYTVISRFDGYVVARHVEIGAWVKTGDPICDVIELDEVELKTYVAEQHINHIQPGAQVSIIVPSIPGRTFSGIVKNIIPQADMRARTFPVLVRVKNEIAESGPLLKSGMVARVDLPTGSVRDAILVSKDALVLGGKTPIVFVVQPGDAPNTFKAVPVPVEIGIANQGKIQIVGDIKPGQKVVVEGNERLRPGQAVVISSQR
jgi:HlyD family secretion protein